MEEGEKEEEEEEEEDDEGSMVLVVPSERSYRISSGRSAAGIAMY